MGFTFAVMSIKVGGPRWRLRLQFDEKLMPGASLQQRCRWICPWDSPDSAATMADFKNLIAADFGLRGQLSVIVKNHVYSLVFNCAIPVPVS